MSRWHTFGSIRSVGCAEMPAAAAIVPGETGYPKLKRTYGNIPKKTEVPRIALMEALEPQTDQKLVRSDWIAVGDAPESPEACNQLVKLPPNFVAGEIYIDCFLPV